MIILTELYNGDSNPLHCLVSRMPNALIHCHHYCNDLEGADFIQENSVGCSGWWIRPTIRSKSIILTPNHAQILVWFTFVQNRTQIQGFYSWNDIFSDPNSKNSHFCHFFELFLSRPCRVYYSWSDIIWGPNREMGTSVQIVISRFRLRNRVKCLIPRPGRWTHGHHHHVTHIEFLRSLHNRPFGQLST